MTRGLHFYSRIMRGNALPLAVRHLHPSISEANMRIHGLTRGIRTLEFAAADCDGCIAKYCDLQILVIGECIFRRFRIGKTLSLPCCFVRRKTQPVNYTLRDKY